MALRRRNWGHSRSLLVAVGLLLGWRTYATAQIITEYAVPNSGFDSRPTQVSPLLSTSRPGRMGPCGLQYKTAMATCCNPIGQDWTHHQLRRDHRMYSVREPFYITAGPDGALWFTHATGIGRITTAGVVTDHPAPLQELPNRHCRRPGWRAVVWRQRHERDRAHHNVRGITEYALPTGCGAAGIDIAITPGPDGALWFTLGKAPGGGCSSIGRISTAGAIAIYPYPRSAQLVHPPNQDRDRARRRVVVYRSGSKCHRAHHDIRE